MPVSPHRGNVTRLKLARHGLTLGISWGAVPGATSYELVARLAAGGERVVRARRLGISLKRIERYDSGMISVRALATLRQGNAALGRLSPAGPTRLGRLPRPPRRI